MLEEALKNWVEKEKSRGVLQNAGLAVFLFVAGLLVLFLTFWLTYAILTVAAVGISAASELAGGGEFHLSHTVRLVCSAVFIVLLFVQHLRTDPWHWGDYPVKDYSTIRGVALHAGAVGGLAAMLIHPGASANMIADILLSGPRLTMGTFKAAARARALRKVDANGCAKLLAVLFYRPAAVPLDELSSAGWDPWVEQLREFEGVRVLQKGVALSSELRMELGTVLAEQPRG